MDKEILTVATFEENCEYQSSTSSRKVALPQQLVQVNLSNPINMEEPRPPNTFCYDDKIKLVANVTYANDNSVFIQTGRIEFYFIPEGTKKPILINKAEVSYNNDNEPNIKQTCELNNEGTAAVYFKPTDSGKVFARYIDDNEIYTTANSEEIDLILQGIPVDIEFDELPPYIADIHDEVTIRVHVTNAHDGTDIRYGLVTFLHYLDYNDENTPNKRVPSIIGNPVPVFDGYAKIRYIPVQSDDYDYTDTEQNTEPEVLQNFYQKRNIEYIRASYNYSGKYIDTEKESYKWKYYNTNSKWTAISVLARNAINVNPPRINKTALALNGEKGVYQCKESDTITLSAILKDKNNEIIDFSNSYTGKLTFHIKGTHPHPKKPHTQNKAPQTYLGDYTQTSEEFEFIRYEEDIEAEWSNDTSEFIAQINKPLPGFYSVSATTTIMTQKSNLLLIDAENIQDDKKYAEVTNSNTIYISSEYDNILQNIVLQHDTYFNQTKEKINNLIGNVDGLTNNQMNILNNKTCYFYVSETNKTYRGTLTYNSDTNELTGEPSEDITFNTSGDYHISMYIPYGIYTDNTSVTEYHHDIKSTDTDSVHDFYLPYYSSVPITMQIRDEIELELSIDTISNTLPGNFLYTLSGKYIKDEVSVDIFKKATGSSVEDKITNGLQLFRQYNKIIDTFKINQVGTYEIYAKTPDGIQSNTVEIEVKKESFNQTLLESSKKIFASIDTKIGVYLTCLENNINLVNEEKIHAYLYDSNKSDEKPVNITNTRIINDKTMYLEIAPKIWKEGTWYIKVKYDDGDENFSQYNGILEKFTSVLDTPTVKLIPYKNNYKVNIQSPHFKEQFFVVPVNFFSNNNKVGQGIYITYQDGSGGFDENVNNLPWWDKWNNVSFDFNPYDTDLINILTNKNPPHGELESKYRFVFDEHDIAQDNDQLLWQLEYNDYNYIYDTYKPSYIRIARPTSL